MLNLKKISMKKSILFLLLSVIAIGIVQAQLPSPFPPKFYQSYILFVDYSCEEKMGDSKHIMHFKQGNENSMFKDITLIPQKDISEVSDKVMKRMHLTLLPTVVEVNDDIIIDYNDEIKASQITEDTIVYEKVDVAASFPEGMAALMTWLSYNIHYPASALENNIKGKVVVNFIVEKDGTISNAKIAKSLNADLDKEAIRVVNKMPKWNPGINKGVPVRSYFTLPINFRF